MQSLDNTFMRTNGEITLQVIPEVFTRYLTDCEMRAFRVDMHFPFLYSALCLFSNFFVLLRKFMS